MVGSVNSPANGSFFDNIDRLILAVGDGEIEATNDVDQVYARYQHEGTDFAHPRGGKDHYARDPLFGEADKRWGAVADRVLTETGSDLKPAMVDLSEKQAADIVKNAPREYGDLERSSHPRVVDNGVTIYDRPPEVKRLSAADLKLKHAGRDHREGKRGRFRARAPKKGPRR